jgi:hypothetical protein
VEQRLAALEAAAAGLETRLDARTSFGGAGSLASADRGIEVTTRLTALEQRVDALVADIRRLERQTDQASSPTPPAAACQSTVSPFATC